jgi:hypothetical protein
MAITTDHGFTAVTITQMVDDIEEEIGASGVVAVDDAQLENIDLSVLVARPDLRVVKCLTRISGASLSLRDGAVHPGQPR